MAKKINPVKFASQRFNRVNIVGSGPCGMFTALKLKELCPDLEIAIFEKKRWGGLGTSSDGKLTLSPEIGGRLLEFVENGKLLKVIDYVEKTFLYFGFPRDRVFGVESAEKIEELKIKTLKAGLHLIPFKIRHAGTDKIRKVTENIRKHLERSGIKIYLHTPVKHVLKSKKGIILELENGKRVKGDFVILAPGRGGARWLKEEAENLGLNFTEPKKVGVDIGIRVEVPYEILKEFTDLLYEFKIEKYTECYDDRVRTFCVCPRGKVRIENKDLATVNGHSYRDRKRWSSNTNFAILVTANFTYPFREPNAYGEYVAGLVRTLGGGKPIIQRLGDLKDGRRSTWEKIRRGIVKPTLKRVEPGDLSYAIPERIMRNIREFLENLEAIFPGLNDRHTLLYGPEVKFYSNQIETREGFETMVDGLYVGGDGSGYSRSIVHAASMGVIIAENIAKKLKN